MTNERYLIVSYFVVGLVSLGLGVAAYRVLCTPFAAIADAVTGKSGSALWKRVLRVSLTMAAVLGFLSVSYTQHGCVNYEYVVKDRNYLVQMNREQLQSAGDWIVYAVFAWCAVVVICLVIWRNTQERNPHE
jgi:hypothetical protein